VMSLADSRDWHWQTWNLAKIRKCLIGDLTLAESRYWLTGEDGDKDGLPDGDEDWLTTEHNGIAEMCLMAS
jgi:hypothetical protein